MEVEVTTLVPQRQVTYQCPAIRENFAGTDFLLQRMCLMDESDG